MLAAMQQATFPLAILLSLWASAAADVRLPNVFSDHMARPSAPNSENDQPQQPADLKCQRSASLTIHATHP